MSPAIKISEKKKKRRTINDESVFLMWINELKTLGQNQIMSCQILAYIKISKTTTSDTLRGNLKFCPTAEVTFSQPLPYSASSMGSLQQYQSHWQAISGISPANLKQMYIIFRLSLLSCCYLLPQACLSSIHDQTSTRSPESLIGIIVLDHSLLS